MPVTDSPLRYPGGKTQLSPFVEELLRTNDLYGGVYAEPFAGGAGIAWRLLLRGHVSEIWLNDIDPAIFAFWTTVKMMPDALCERILETEITVSQWKKQRLILNDASASLVDLAFATLFLNRTNRSGILDGGVIGGQSQSGTYKIDCRFNREGLVRKIQNIKLHRHKIRITGTEATRCIDRWSKSFPARGLIYIDPPYFVQGRQLYLNSYDYSDHRRLSKVVHRLAVPWMLTYDDVPEVETLYAGLPQYRKGLNYSAQVKRRTSELLIIPPFISPPRNHLSAFECQFSSTSRAP